MPNPNLTTHRVAPSRAGSSSHTSHVSTSYPPRCVARVAAPIYGTPAHAPSVPSRICAPRRRGNANACMDAAPISRARSQRQARGPGSTAIALRSRLTLAWLRTFYGELDMLAVCAVVWAYMLGLMVTYGVVNAAIGGHL